MSDDRYSRMYHRLVDDDRFATIYGDDHHFATWARLLMIGDEAWPASAHLPAGARKASVRALADAGLIEIRPGGMYRIHGSDAERSRRSESAKLAADARWGRNATGNADRNATGNAEVMLNEQSSKRAEQEQETSSDARADLDAFVAVRRRIPTPRQRDFMDAYVGTFDQTGPERAARLIWANPDDPIGALKADLAEFREGRRAEALASEVPKPVRRRKPSGFTGVNAEIAKALAGVDAKRGENGMQPLSELLPEAFAASRGAKP